MDLVYQIGTLGPLTTQSRLPALTKMNQLSPQMTVIGEAGGADRIRCGACTVSQESQRAPSEKASGDAVCHGGVTLRGCMGLVTPSPCNRLRGDLLHLSLAHHFCNVGLCFGYELWEVLVVHVRGQLVQLTLNWVVQMPTHPIADLGGTNVGLEPWLRTPIE